MTDRRLLRRAALIAGGYLGAAGLWIVVSDWVLYDQIASPPLTATWSMVKGWGFVVFTTLALFLVLSRVYRREWRTGEQARRILACVGDGLYGIDAHGRCTFANPALLRLLGYPTDADLIGRDMHGLIHHHHADGRPFPIADCLVHGRIRDGQSFRGARETVFARDGRPILVEVAGEPLTDDQGRLMGAVISLTDVSATEQARVALAESEQRFRRLFHNTPVPYQSLDGTGRILEVNPAWLRLFGYEREAVIGRAFADFLTDEGRQLFPDRFARFKDRGEICGVEFDVVPRSGSPRRIAFEGRISRLPKPREAGGPAARAPEGGDDGAEWIQTHCVLSDLTERRAFLALIERSVQGLTQADAELVRFSRVVSHDLQEPIREVVSFLDLARRRLGGRLTAEEAEFMGFASDAACRMKAQLVALQDFSDVIATRPQFEPVALGPLWADTVGEHTATLDRERATLEASDLPAVRGDRGLLAVLLRCLLVNALTYRREDPLTLTLSAKVTGSFASLRLEDTGRGIEREQRGRVFEAYSRLTRPGDPPGSGMGLAMCRKICELHNGTIWIEDRLDGRPGTAVCLRLPLAEAANQDPAPEPALSPSRRTG